MVPCPVLRSRAEAWATPSVTVYDLLLVVQENYIVISGYPRAFNGLSSCGGCSPAVTAYDYIVLLYNKQKVIDGYTGL